MHHSFMRNPPSARPHIGTIFFLEGELSFDKLFNQMRQRLHICPLFRQRLIFSPFNLAHATIEETLTSSSRTTFIGINWSRESARPRLSKRSCDCISAA